MVGVEHVGPDDDPRAGVDRLEDRRASARVLGQKLARRQLAVLAGAAPVGDPDLVVRHEERLGVEQIIDATGLVAQDLVELGLAQAAHDLRAVGDDRVIPAHAEAVAAPDPRPGVMPDRRAGMVELEFARPGDLAQLGVGDRLEVAAFLVGRLAVGRLDEERAPLRLRTLTSASSSSARSSTQKVPLPSPQKPA